MRVMGSSGIWELFVPGLKPGLLYKFVIKTDPLAFSSRHSFAHAQSLQLTLPPLSCLILAPIFPAI